VTVPLGADLSVDIVVNNHNYSQFVADAIESALAQSHPKTNVLVVDDGSTDRSREIIGRYGDRATVILKEQGGQASAINAGLEHSQGDVVMFLDADDRLEPEAAARVATAFAADESVVKVQFRTRVLAADGRPTGVVKPDPHLPMPQGDMRRAELDRPYDIVWMATSANAFRARDLRRILPIPEAVYPKTGADWYLVHLAALLGPVASLPDPLGGYRVHGDNSYEPSEPVLDLAHTRQAIGYAQATSPELLRLAAELGLPRPGKILSIADLAARITSLRLQPDRHPVAADGRLSLVADSIRGLARRDDVNLPMKLLMAGWFGAMAVLPRSLARPLAELFLFPARRSAVNALLGRLHRKDD
jgi:hypothetical protein